MDPARFVPNWHIDAICEHLEAVAKGDIRRLLINIPPRHMKSLAVSVAFPAWVWAQDGGKSPLTGPHVRFLFASYAQTLAIRDSVKCRRLIESPWYQQNWGGRFRLTDDQNTKIRFENDHQGMRLATSVDGALTGEGGDIIVVDDPHNVTEAESEAVREAALSWWDEAMSTRLNDPRTGAYIAIMQRVHERDLSGHILAREHEDWTHLCLPARYEPDHPHVYGRDHRKAPGELLWPERLGEPEVRKLEQSLGSYGAAGQLQQRPAPREGGMFKRRWFPIVPAAPAMVASRVRKWDLAGTIANGTNDPDWTVGLLMSRDEDGVFYIEDVVRFRDTPAEVEKTIVATASQDAAIFLKGRVRIGLNEDPGQAGKAQITYLVRKLAGHRVEFERETGAKDIRATPLAAQAEAGNVRVVAGPWNEAFFRELEVFPMAAHDDQVDAASGAFNLLIKRRQIDIPDDVLRRSAMPGPRR
jgi:predicted phage terminase large subunit-like protein